jgi:hypothetical protein
MRTAKVNDTTKITCFSRFLSIETLVFRDSKLQVHQRGDDSEFVVLGRRIEAEMNEFLLTKPCGQEGGERYHQHNVRFSQYLSIDTLVFHDSKLQVHQGDDDSVFDAVVLIGQTK